jgi:hypothetical protein
MAGKHVPQRTCISCRTIRGKREFVRIVRVTANHLEADETGKKSGRGAYLCRQRECWDEALSQPQRLQQALKMDQRIIEEDLTHLREAGKNFPRRPAAAVDAAAKS